MKQINIFCLVLMAGVGMHLTGDAQINIIGASCVKPGTEYHYRIESNSIDSFGYKICVQGGSIIDIPDTCIIQFSSSEIKIIWGNAFSGSLNISSNNNSSTFSVEITPELNPGDIDTSSIEQLIDQETVPVTIKCSKASAGNCTPLYSYQWQQSLNKIVWQDISGAKGQNLVFNEAVNDPTYYRRKDTEVNSMTTKYTSIASVYIIPKSN